MQQLALITDIPRARRHDPPTSHIAAKRIRESGKADAHRSLIVSAIRRKPGMTYKMIADVVGLEPVAVGRRLVEAERATLIQPGPVRDGMRTWWPA